ncbi:MAG: DUF5103 domain-containing protein [Chitinophagaceae bacterium]
MQKIFLPVFSLIFSIQVFALPFAGEVIKSESIKSIKLFPVGDQTSYAIVPLNAEEQLELHFDDINVYSKNYYYTYQLCDADWVPVDLSQFDYIKGFSQVRLTLFRQSSVSITRYVHYSAKLPAKNCMPSRSGNYLLKVFENGDTTKLAFTKKMLVVDNKVAVGLTITHPFSGVDYRFHQRAVININPTNLDIFNVNQQLKVVVLQNFRWDNAQVTAAPTFIRNKVLEYNQEGLFDFEGGKEWRWLDLRSFRLQSDRVRKAEYTDKGTEIFVVADTARPQLRYQYYKDFNGMYFLAMFENYNPWWQSDYAKVHFTFVPENHEAFTGQDVFLLGELTQFQTNDNSRMQYNTETGFYERDLFLKNGYYSYEFATKDRRPGSSPMFKYTEGNNWDTENNYTALVYYKGFGGRADELIGTISVNSLGSLTR